MQEAEIINNINNACPDGDSPICLVGLRPFIAAKHLLVSGSHLVLLASSEQDPYLNPSLPTRLSSSENPADAMSSETTSKWTVYSLTLPNSLSLHKDMIHLANMNRVLSPHGYFQLICEAHMVLRTSIHDLAWRQLTSSTTSEIVNEETETELNSTKEKYHETCLLLANTYVLSHDYKDWKQALPYYRMSNSSSSSIIKHAMELWKKSNTTGRSEIHRNIPPGLVYYISQIILNPVSTSDERENILQESGLADLVIDVLGEYAISSLAQIILKSSSFRQFKTTKMHNYFKLHLNDRPNPDANEVIAFALLTIHMGEAGAKYLEIVRKYLQLSSSVLLSQVCIDHYHFLIDSSISSEGHKVGIPNNFDRMGENFSDLAILIRNSVPEIFVEILVSLIKAEKLLLGSVLGLFISSFVSMSSPAVSDHSRQNAECSATHNTAMIQLFLETYFQELLHDSQTQGSITLDEEQTQALQTLVRSYLTSLSIPVRFVERNVDSNIFGPRKLYLDKLPPFQSSEKLEAEMLAADSPDFWCQNSLLKLQSLLCSVFCESDPSSHNIILSFLDVKPDTIGYVSLKLLCCESQNDKELQAVTLLVDNNPDVLLGYAKECDFDMNGWTILLKVLQDRLTHDNEKEELQESWYASMQEILDYLAQLMTLEAFLEVLPSKCPQNNEEFQCHIQMCRKNQQAHQIQNLIVSTGNKLLSTLTL